MRIVDIISLAMFHPQELRAMVTYKVWRDPLNDIKANPEESGWNRESMQACWGYLDLTSRSFAAVIKELRGEMSRFICIFYLALRALDTIEDDMTIDPARKIELLTNFYRRLEEPGWNFKDSELIFLYLISLNELLIFIICQGGPNEKDRELLVGFDKVIEEFQRLDRG